jgi:hypothetical protein
VRSGILLSHRIEQLRGGQGVERQSHVVLEAFEEVLEITQSRESRVGAIGVRRALPRRGRRTVGPWCFVDHMGPALVSAPRGLDIAPHPHIGLQTVTWLLEGEALHRDSLGSEQVIVPGELNLMTAGWASATTKALVVHSCTCSRLGAALLNSVARPVPDPRNERAVGASEGGRSSGFPLDAPLLLDGDALLNRISNTGFPFGDEGMEVVCKERVCGRLRYQVRSQGRQ